MGTTKKISRSAPPLEEAGAPRLNPGHLPELLGFHLRMAQLAVYQDFTKTLGELDLTQKQYSTLELIAANPGVSQIALARASGNDRATTMTHINGLEGRGLVTRVPSSIDGRRQDLFVSPEGAGLIDAARGSVRAHEERITSQLTADEVRRLIGMLARIHRRC